MNRFHLALAVDDLEKARVFYRDVLGLREHRSAFNWVDFDFYGNQLSLQLVAGDIPKVKSCSIDGDQVPATHFGMILTREQWEELKERLTRRNQNFLIGPKLRFEGNEGEQGTMFIADPCGNYLEFKYFTDTSKGPWY